MKVHWITLDVNSKRAKGFIAVCDTIGLEHEPFVAVRGDTSNIVVSDAMRLNLSKAELGCMSSHLYMLDMAAKSQDNWFMVCEDDIDFSKWPKGLVLEDMLSKVDHEADMVKFHMHSIALFSVLDSVFADDTLNFVKAEPLNAMAYVIAPAAAQRLVSKYKRGDKWVIPGGVPIDVWHRQLARTGELSMLATPLFIETHGLDSALTGSRTVLRLRKAGDLAVYHTILHPTRIKAVYASRLAEQTAREFRNEILVSVAVFGIVWYMCRNN